MQLVGLFELQVAQGAIQFILHWAGWSVVNVNPVIHAVQPIVGPPQVTQAGEQAVQVVWLLR